MLNDHRPSSDSLLLESEQRYQAVIENASDIIQSVRPDGTFEFVNKAWLDTLGYEPSEVTGLNIWDIIYQDSIEECSFWHGDAGYPAHGYPGHVQTQNRQTDPRGGKRQSPVRGRSNRRHPYLFSGHH